MLCDALMHRAIFYSQAYYVKRVPAADRKAFQELYKAAHNDMNEFADSWRNYLGWRKARGMRVAYGMKAATVQASLENGDMAGAAARIQRLRGEAPAPAAVGAAAAPAPAAPAEAAAAPDAAAPPLPHPPHRRGNHVMLGGTGQGEAGPGRAGAGWDRVEQLLGQALCEIRTLVFKLHLLRGLPHPGSSRAGPGRAGPGRNSDFSVHRSAQ